MGKGSWIRGLAVAVAIAVGWAGSGAAQALLTKDQFRERVVQEVLRAQPGAKVERQGAFGLSATLPGEEPKAQSLERGYVFYQGEPARLDEYVRNLSAAYAPTRVTPESLLILVRSSASNPPPGPGGDRAIVRPIAGDLIALVAVDTPESYEFLRASILRRRLKLDDAAIWARAQANTRAALPFQPRPLKPGQPALIESGKGLASSLLADDAFWDAPVMTAGGPVAVAALARDNLYVTPLSDTKMVQALKTMIAKVADDPNTLAPRLLVRRNRHWEVLP